MQPNGVDVVSVITQAGAVGLIGVMVWFFINRFFPWYTERYIPEKWAREDRVEAENTAILRGINENLVELRTSMSNNLSGLSFLRELATSEFSSIQHQLESVTMLASIGIGEASKVSKTTPRKRTVSTKG